MLEIAQRILEQIADPFDLEQASKKHKHDYLQSMNTFLIQELERYNYILKIIKSSL